MIEYKGYIGVVDFDPEIDLFHGTVINTQDVITFYGASVTEIREEMQKSLEVYFEVCEEQGKVPDKPFSGELTIQTSPELYGQIAMNAARSTSRNRCLPSRSFGEGCLSRLTYFL